MMIDQLLLLIDCCEVIGAGYNQKKQNMKIDEFLLDTEPLNKLVTAYVELEQVYDKAAKAENHRKQTVYLNSILVSLATKQATVSELWNEIKYCLQVNSGDRDCLRRGAQLLLQVFKRNPQSLQTAPKEIILEIVQLSCQKALITICGNDFIALIEHISSKLSLASDLQLAMPSITNLIASNKLQVNTYRQQTRLCLYKILLKLLNLQKQQSSNAFLEKCVKAGEGQKDPRNIGAVFQLYLKVLAIFPTEQLLPFRASMFENIEAYYPIEFIGDEDNQEHRKVNLQEISSLLDQCLCHPFFSELSWELLSSKTAAPPLAPFISTLLAYCRSLRLNPNPALNTRLASLLLRFCEEQFIAEEYEQHAAVDVSTVIEALLDVIVCREDGSFSVEGLTVARKWLEVMLGKATNGECHHSGTIMGIFRAVINRSNTPRFAALVELVRSLSLKAILRTISDGEIIPKLGLAVVVVTSADRVSEDVRELIGLLVLKIGNLYATVSDQIKLLLLKILLQVYKGSESSRAMVRKVNNGQILKDILVRAQTAFGSCPNANQAYLIKAFIDFVATVHAHEIDLLLQHITGVNFELEGYLLARLWQNLIGNQEQQSNAIKITSKLDELIKLLNKSQDGENLVKGLRAITKPLLFKLVVAANWQRQPNSRQLIFSVLLNLRQALEASEINLENSYQLKKLSPLSQIISQFILNKNQLNLCQSKQELLWRALGHQEKTSTAFPLMTNIGAYDENTNFLQKFISAYPPTFIQWSWERLMASEQYEMKGKRLGEILRWLPEPILLRDRKDVLNLILTDSRCAPSLLKIVKNIELETIKSAGIVDYCLQYLHSLGQEHPDNTTQRSTCIIATLISIAEKDKQGELKQTIRKFQKVLRGLKQHRKRPVRQAVRRLLSILQQ